MKYALFSRVALKLNLPDQGFRSGDVATIVEQHPGDSGREPGYTLEVFNAAGETMAVFTLAESEIEPLTANEMLHVRKLTEAS
jgi:hypothetical protein